MEEGKQGTVKATLLWQNKMGMETSNILPDYTTQRTYITIDAFCLFYLCCEKAHFFHCTLLIRLPFIILAQMLNEQQSATAKATITATTKKTKRHY